ncbi:Protein of unknown function [Gryllus bimaculatus]|nr:Protein of unknown function [Gryllus bimaculatus]
MVPARAHLSPVRCTVSPVLWRKSPEPPDCGACRCHFAYLTLRSEANSASCAAVVLPPQGRSRGDADFAEKAFAVVFIQRCSVSSSSAESASCWKKTTLNWSPDFTIICSPPWNRMLICFQLFNIHKAVKTKCEGDKYATYKYHQYHFKSGSPNTNFRVRPAIDAPQGDKISKPLDGTMSARPSEVETYCVPKR